MISNIHTLRRKRRRNRLFLDWFPPTSDVPRMIEVSDVTPGDVLLCWPQAPDFWQKGIQAKTGSKYVHAAIAYSTNPMNCAEVGFSNGIVRRGALKITPLEALVSRYGHVAVLRNPDAWSQDAVGRLEKFVQEILGRTRYGALKAYSVRERYDQRQTEQLLLLDRYFSEKAPQRQRKKSYFCSEFVVECFIESGYLHESASILYNPEDTAPGHLIADNTFGVVVGYLSGLKNYVLPQDEPLQSQTRYDVIFPVDGGRPQAPLRRRVHVGRPKSASASRRLASAQHQKLT